jgi:hypothetical protein
MEVMNRAELTQNDILVGQNSKTRSFGVSDDPMLMSMLSTGFYQNPLRTMIQEVMFNAWDAHRMGNCQDRPIDIYINETSGLIIRDYGPGIDPGPDDDNMHEIYCMYGGSTKRKLKNQTGGFGLGSKSPFAYTESFTVTSHFGGTKNMYLISRVSEANGGKPGMTSLIRVPTTETGLLVTIPLKRGDMLKAYEYVKDVLILSGIKAMLHYEDEKDEYIDSESLAAGEYKIMTTDQPNGIYAVYGGVRYKIPKEDYYAQEYEFMQLLSKNQSMFVGFAPDTLSPLPNREGLNMGEKSKESVKSNFELCTEKFQETFPNLVKSFHKNLMRMMKAHNLQGHFAFIKAAAYGPRSEAADYRGVLREHMISDIPAGVNAHIWEVCVSLALNQTSTIMKMYGLEKWKVSFISAFMAEFPDHIQLGYAALKVDFRTVFPLNDRDQTKEFVQGIYNPKFLREQANFHRFMKETYPDDDALHLQMRIYSNDWEFVTNERTKSNLDKTKYGVKGLKPEDPRLKRKDSHFDLLQMWNAKGEELEFLMMEKTIVIAKTVTALKDVTFPKTFSDHLSALKSNGYGYYRNFPTPAPCYVIHQRKGAYDKALEYLKAQGFNVIEGDEPEKKIYVPKKKVELLYSRINPKNSETWLSVNPDDQIADPTHYWYATQATLKGYSSRERIEHSLIYWFMKKNPKLVMVNHAKMVENLAKKGAVLLDTAIVNWYDAQASNPQRMMNVIRAARISKLAGFTSDILREPYMQLELGMDLVDKSDTDFWYESDGYNLIMSCEYYPLQSLRRRVASEIESLWIQDPERKNIEAMCDRTKIFNQHVVSSLWSDTKIANRPALVDKIIAAMKLFN